MYLQTAISRKPLIFNSQKNPKIKQKIHKHIKKTILKQEHSNFAPKKDSSHYEGTEE